MNYILLFLNISVFAFFSTKLCATSLVAKDQVNITAEAKKDAAVLQTLKKGEEIEAIERKGMFWQVKTAKGNGFVSFMAMKKKDEKGGLSEALRKAAKQSRESEESNGTRARSAVMGVRGLTDKDKVVSEAGSVRPDLRTVFAMEDVNLAKAKVKDIERQVLTEIESKQP